MFECFLPKFAFDEFVFPMVWLAVACGGKTSSITMKHESNNQDVVKTHSSCLNSLMMISGIEFIIDFMICNCAVHCFSINFHSPLFLPSCFM